VEHDGTAGGTLTTGGTRWYCSWYAYYWWNTRVLQVVRLLLMEHEGTAAGTLNFILERGKCKIKEKKIQIKD
jgi:hypothetical protein